MITSVFQKIIQLRHGCLFDKDNALQILLIIGYIFDWTRDIYRPTVIRFLKVVTHHRPYDQMSLLDDFDNVSASPDISPWVRSLPTIVGMRGSGAVAQDAVIEEDEESPEMIEKSLGQILRMPCTKKKNVAILYIGSPVLQRWKHFGCQGATLEPLAARVAGNISRFFGLWVGTIPMTVKEFANLARFWSAELFSAMESSIEPFPVVYTIVEIMTDFGSEWEIQQTLRIVAGSAAAIERMCNALIQEWPMPRLFNKQSASSSTGTLNKVFTALNHIQHGTPTQAPSLSHSARLLQFVLQL